MNREKGGPALWLAQVINNMRRGLTPMWLCLGLTIVATVALTGLTGCENNPSPAACLNSGDPFCDDKLNNNGGTGNNTGTGGNTNVACSDNPNYGEECQLPGGGIGHWVCASNGVDLVCAGSGTGGSGATGGSAGNGGSGGGTYNCAEDPNNGDPCIAADGTSGHWGCNGTGTALFCFPDGGTGGSGGTGGGGQYNCSTDPQLGTPCVTSDGHQGVKICNVSGTGLVCQCTVDCGGTGGTGGGTGGSGGGEIYNCLTDPNLGDICVMGVGICSRTGIYVCNAAGDGLRCSTNAGLPNPVGEVCDNNLDDDCDGTKDELPCTNGGGGGSGGTGGSGGSGGSGGYVSCTPVSSMQVMAVGGSSLYTLLMGQVTVSSSNPWIQMLTNNQLFSLASDDGLSLSTNAGAFNYFEPYVGGGGDPMPMIDNLFCRQLGIDPPTPASCNASVIGDRHSTNYMAALRIDWQCWDNNSTCPVELIGHMPGDMFAQQGAPAAGSPLSLPGYAFEEFGLGQIPPLCP